MTEPTPSSLALPPCPSWCQDPELHSWHDLELVPDENGGPLLIRAHDGPDFGPFRTGGSTLSDGSTTAYADLDDPQQPLLWSAPEELRRLAAHALAAADWLAAAQST